MSSREGVHRGGRPRLPELAFNSDTEFHRNLPGTSIVADRLLSKLYDATSIES